nr:T9SS type A sorting domain-containing protein [uncultured Psychroserpens sp.]
MKKITLLFLLLPFLGLSQVQIGQDIDGLSNSDRFGESISLSSDGSIVAIGATGNNAGTNSSFGYVDIYENIGGVWYQIGNTINGEVESDDFGLSVSLSSDGSIVAIGANQFENGNVRVFENLGGNWTQVGQTIYGQSGNFDEDFGISVDLSSDGTILAVGAIGGNNITGNVRVYINELGTWTQIGNDINGEAQEDNFGLSVSLSSDGSTVAIGGHRNDGNGSNSGHIKVYQNTNNVWNQIGQDIDGVSQGDNFGFSVSLSSDGSRVAVGAMNSNDGTGSAHIFQNNSGVWNQLGQSINGDSESGFDRLGWSISLSSNGSIVLIGAPGNDEIASNSGSVKILKLLNNNWVQVGENINGIAASESVGESVSISSDGNIITFGAIGANITGQARVYDLSALLSVNNLLTTDFSIYPNPTKNQFTIQLDTSVELQKVTIYNILGQAVLISEENIINTSKLSSGSYIVEILTNKGKSSKKLIIE